MAQNQKKGMRLTNAEGLQTIEYEWILPTVIKLLAFIVLVLNLTKMTGINEISHPWTMLIPGAILCLASGILTKLKRQNWFYPGVLAVQILLMLCFWKQMIEGIAVLWNRIGYTYTANTGWALPELITTDADGETTVTFAVISLVLTLLCSVLCDYVPIILGLLLAAAPLAGIWLLNWEPDIGYLIPSLLTGILILAYSGGKNRPISAVIISWGLIFALGLMCVPMAMTETLTTKGDLVRGQVQEKVHEVKYETAQTTLPEGDFSQFTQNHQGNNQKTKKDSQPALVVRTDTPEVMYLRGFTGTTFEDNQWIPLDTEILAENKDMLYGLHLHAFQPDNQFEKALQSAGEIETHQIIVENTDACSRYQYVPFSLCDGIYLQAENLNTDGVVAGEGRIYTYNVVTGSIDAIEKTVRLLQKSEQKDVLTYRSAESKYRTFVYDQYLQIPQDVMEQMEPSWQAVAERYEKNDNLTTQQRQECVQTFLEMCFASEEGAEVSLPLQCAEGTSFQEATVSAMTLRYFGIPSRYAEGYIISEKMAFEAEPGSAIQVDSSCADAWVEVYQDGLGWIPMELVLGIEEQERDSNGEDEDSDMTEGIEIEEIPKDDVNPPEPTGGSRVKVVQQITLGLLKYAGLLLAAAIILVIRRIIILKKKEKKYQDSHINHAIGWIFADTAALMTKMGFDRGNGSMKKLYTAVGESFDEDYSTMFEHTEKLNSRALFSNHMLSEEDRMHALEFREMTKQKLIKNITWYKRIWLKWIKCLY